MSELTIILITIKKMLGIDQADTSFDTDIIVNINSVLSDLNLLGVGVPEGFIITDSTLWTDLLGTTKMLELVKTYIYLKVRIVFDPPQNSFLVTAMEKQINEYGWKITIQVEEDADE